MPATLPPLEDEAPGSIFEIHLEKARRRYVQVGENTVIFEHPCLIRSSPGD